MSIHFTRLVEVTLPSPTMYVCMYSQQPCHSSFYSSSNVPLPRSITQQPTCLSSSFPNYSQQLTRFPLFPIPHSTTYSSSTDQMSNNSLSFFFLNQIINNPPISILLQSPQQPNILFILQPQFTCNPTFPIPYSTAHSCLLKNLLNFLLRSMVNRFYNRGMR